MALFRRRGEPVPAWSPFAAADDWRAFAAAVRGEARARGWRLDLGAGLAHEGDAKYGLHNVARACRSEPVAAWPAVVRAHFDRVVSAGSARRFDSAAEARAALKARLVDDDFFTHATSEPVWRRVADTLRLALAFDLPEAVVLPDRAELLEWGEADELFAVALDNTRLEPGLQLERHALDGDVAVWSLAGESFFAATHALWADGFDPPPSGHGTLVAVPSRHVVLAHPIRDAGAITAMTTMLGMAAGIHAEDQGALSDALYWLRDGRLERLDARLDDAGVSFAPSGEFLAMMERWV